jgi:hypothetical protein
MLKSIFLFFCFSFKNVNRATGSYEILYEVDGKISLHSWMQPPNNNKGILFTYVVDPQICIFNPQIRKFLTCAGPQITIGKFFTMAPRG